MTDGQEGRKLFAVSANPDLFVKAPSLANMLELAF